MAANSNIEWTDRTWNPVAGCSIVSPGCHNCYAMKMAKRLAAMGQQKYVGTTKTKKGKTTWTGKINLSPGQLDDPLGWKKPQRIFVNSMSDLFHKNVPNEFIADVFATMYNAQWHTFQVLTKRPDRMASLLSNPRMPFAMATLLWNRLKTQSPEKAEYVTDGDMERDIRDMWPLPNVWLGTSVEDQKRADERIPWLLKTPAAVRFLSCEPLLGPIEFSDVTKRSDAILQLGTKAMTGIDWVIVGGESGPGCRPCNIDWIRSIVKQCQSAGVPAFVKQLGGFPTDIDDEEPRYMKKHADVYRIQSVKDKKGGDPSEWPAGLDIRQFPEVAHV